MKSLGYPKIAMTPKMERTTLVEGPDDDPATRISLDIDRSMIPAAPPLWDCGPIGTKTPTRTGKPGHCVYSCITEADMLSLAGSSPERGSILRNQLVGLMARTGQVHALDGGRAIDLEFVGGRMTSATRSTSCAAPTPKLGEAPPKACECPPKGASWWWLVAIGVGGLWAGTRMPK